MRIRLAFLTLACIGAVQQVTPQDVDSIFMKADQLFEEAKAGYDDGRAKSSVQVMGRR
jgi:hypothetical protein